MEEEKNRKGKKNRKPFCSSWQMGRLSVCITIMEFRAHWQKFTNSSQHPARINNVEALEWRMARRVSKYQSRSAVCSTKQRRPLIVEIVEEVWRPNSHNGAGGGGVWWAEVGRWGCWL